MYLCIGYNNFIYWKYAAYKSELIVIFILRFCECLISVLNGDTEDSVKSESITEMNEDIQILRKSDLTQLSSDRVNSSRELELIKKTDNDVDMTHFNNDCPSTEVNDKDDIVSQPVVICDDNKKLDLMTFEDDIPQDDTLYGIYIVFKISNKITGFNFFL